MKKTFLIWTVLLVFGFTITSCKSHKSAIDATPGTISMECTQITHEGNFIVEVQGNGRNVNSATEAALIYAIKGMLFEGIPGSTANRIQSQTPLVKDSNTRFEKQAYFQNFFDSGDYRMYVETVPNVFPRVVKTDGGYKVFVSVIVKKSLLRHRLEDDGIIKSLSSF